MHALIGQKPMFYQSIKHNKVSFIFFCHNLLLYHKTNEETQAVY